MKNLKSIFFLFYLLFHIAILVVSIYVNARADDFEFLFYLRDKMPFMTYASALGLLLFFTSMFFLVFDSRARAKEKAALEHELNALKEETANA